MRFFTLTTALLLAAMAHKAAAGTAIKINAVDATTDFKMNDLEASSIVIKYEESTITVNPLTSIGTATNNLYFRWDMKSVVDCTTALAFTPFTADNLHGLASGGDTWTLALTNTDDWDLNAASTHGIRTTDEQYEFCLNLYLYYEDGASGVVMDSKSFKFTIDGYGAGTFDVTALNRDVAANAVDLDTVGTEEVDFGNRKNTYLATNLNWDSGNTANAFGEVLTLSFGPPVADTYEQWTIQDPTGIKAKYGAASNDQEYVFPAGLVTITSVSAPYSKTLTLILPEILYTDGDSEIEIVMTIQYSYVSVYSARSLRSLVEGDVDTSGTVEISKTVKLIPRDEVEEAGAMGWTVSSSMVAAGSAMYYVAML